MKVLFYSCKPAGSGKNPEVIKVHNRRSSALKAAGECGQIWDVQGQRQRQVHRSAGDTWMTVKPDSLSTDLEGALRERGWIDAEKEC